MQDTNFLELLIQYFVKLGYEEGKVLDFFSRDKIAEIIAIKLADSNIIPKNKKSKGHQTHIAITGEMIGFFYESIDEFKNSETPDRVLDVWLSKDNIKELHGDVIKIEDVKRPLFVKGKVSIGKRTQNQLQLSKKTSDNSKSFNDLRDGLFENDLFILLKKRDDGAIYVLGIKESFYSQIIREYSLKYNSNVYISINYSNYYDASYYI